MLIIIDPSLVSQPLQELLLDIMCMHTILLEMKGLLIISVEKGSGQN